MRSKRYATMMVRPEHERGGRAGPRCYGNQGPTLLEEFSNSRGAEIEDPFAVSAG